MPYLKNLERDMFWPESYTPLAEGTTNSFAADPLVVRTGNVLFERVGFMRTARAQLTGGPGNKCFGVLLPPPVSDRVPYRVRGSCMASNSATLNHAFGYGFVSAVSADVSVPDPVIFCVGSVVDEMVAVPFNVANPDHNICFFVLSTIESMVNYMAVLSVQRTLGKPPQFSSMVS